jgi:hypothetical protein
VRERVQSDENKREVFLNCTNGFGGVRVFAPEIETRNVEYHEGLYMNILSPVQDREFLFSHSASRIYQIRSDVLDIKLYCSS